MLRTFKKYLRLYRAMFLASLAADLEFRINILIGVTIDIIWYVGQAAVFEVLFRHTNNLGGWTLPQTRVFLGVLFTVDALYMLVFSASLEKFNDNVSKGQFDLLLTKPINSQFFVSCQRANIPSLGNLCIALAYMAWALTTFPTHISALQIFFVFVVIPCGTCIAYAGRFLFALTAVIFTKADYIQHMWYQIYRLGMRPDSIYVPWLRFFLMTFLPVGLIASVPARLVVEPLQPLMVLWMLGMSAAVILFTSFCWERALRHYSSASS